MRGLEEKERQGVAKIALAEARMRVPQGCRKQAVDRSKMRLPEAQKARIVTATHTHWDMEIHLAVVGRRTRRVRARKLERRQTAA